MIEEETEVVFQCDTRQLEQTISVLGQLIGRKVVSTPDYPALLQPSVCTGKKGAAEGVLVWPRGVTLDEKSQRIYVADGGSDIKLGNISVFSVTGEYPGAFCKKQVKSPYGVAVSVIGDNLFVSDSGLHCVFKFKIPNLRLLTKVGKKGIEVGEFNYPHHLTVTMDEVFVADFHNSRVVVMDTDLNHKRYVKHLTMTYPSDVKVSNNKLYVLSIKDNPCLHVSSLNGENIRSFITRDGMGMEDVSICYTFCFDKRQNILMTDYAANNIKVFSQEGALLHKLGDTQDKDKAITPHGITDEQ